MSQATVNRISQSVLLLIWIMIVLVEVTIPAQSQSCLPPLVTPPYMNILDIRHGSWRPVIGEVTVKIDSAFADFTPDARFRIEDGQRKWNSPLTCSGVSFAYFEEALFTPEDLDNDAPFGEVHWEVDDPGTTYAGGVFAHIGFGARVEAATIKIRPNLVFSNPVYFNYLGTHEIGHTFNLNDCISTSTPACLSPGLSIMSGHTNTGLDTQGPNACDFAAVANIYCPPSPTPTATPTPSPTPANQDDCESINWFWNPFADSCQQDPPPSCQLLPEVCENGIWSFQWCGCIPYNTPIVVDVAGDGFDLTGSGGGVNFNLNSLGGNEKLAWTNAGSDDAWLVLDRNGNGTIDDGTELFGEITPQPDPPAGEKKNGFRALAEYDKTSNGGNANGQIESGDSVFSSLRLWRDTNHDGLSEPSELYTLASQNVVDFDLDYKYSKKIDSNGNQFSFRAKVKNIQGQQLGRWAWDVYLVRSL